MIPNEIIEKAKRIKMLVVDIDDPEYSGPGDRIGSVDYEAFIASGDPAAQREKIAELMDVLGRADR